MANIFFIMPFRPGLNYMYLHMKSYIESNFVDTKCIRGDTNISTGLLIKKIRSNIEEADVVIADCSDGNPNVFYELGIAHALGKQSILIHSDAEARVPTDIQGYERLPYGFDDDEAFCENIKKALNSLVRDRYAILYEKGHGYLDAFNATRLDALPLKDEAKFRADVMSRESAAKLPRLNHERKLATYLLPIIADCTLDLDLATEMKEWIANTYPTDPLRSGKA